MVNPTNKNNKKMNINKNIIIIILSAIIVGSLILALKFHTGSNNTDKEIGRLKTERDSITQSRISEVKKDEDYHLKLADSIQTLIAVKNKVIIINHNIYLNEIKKINNYSHPQRMHVLDSIFTSHGI